MKPTDSVQYQLCTICDAVIQLQDSQEATMAWLMVAGRTSSGQLGNELRELIEQTKISRLKVKELRKQLP
jgi:hypothetical protein